MNLENQESSIVTKIKDIVERKWKSDAQPLLLSNLVPELESAGEEISSLFDSERPKSFINRTQTAGQYKLVFHPNQKAKIGIVPADKEYRFALDSVDEEEQVPVFLTSKAGIPPRRNSKFLEALSKLEDSELDQITIPLKVLLKILGER